MTSQLPATAQQDGEDGARGTDGADQREDEGVRVQEREREKDGDRCWKNKTGVMLCRGGERQMRKWGKNGDQGGKSNEDRSERGKG